MFHPEENGPQLPAHLDCDNASGSQRQVYYYRTVGAGIAILPVDTMIVGSIAIFKDSTRTKPNEISTSIPKPRGKLIMPRSHNDNIEKTYQFIVAP